MGIAQTISELLMRQGQTQANLARERGQIWGTALGNIGQQIVSIPAQQRQREAQLQQQELRGLQIQDERGTLADKEKIRVKRQAIEDVLRQYDDIEKAIPAIAKIDIETANTLAKNVNDAKMSALDYRAKRTKAQEEDAAYVGSQLGGANEQNYAKVLYGLKISHPEQDWSGFSGDYNADKPLIQGRIQQALTTKDQLTLKREADEAEAKKPLLAAQTAEAQARVPLIQAQTSEAKARPGLIAAQTREANARVPLIAAQTAEARTKAEGAKLANEGVKPGTKEFRIAQDIAYGKLTMADFNRLYGRAASNAGVKTAIYDKARELNPNFNPATFEMGYKLASNPKVQQQLSSLDNVVKAAPDLIKASNDAARTGIPMVNRIVSKVGYNVGGKSYSNFHVAQIAFADELSGALGYGSATDMSREMGINMTDGNLSPANFAAAINDVVLPFVERKRRAMLDQMGAYGQQGMNPAADAAAPALVFERDAKGNIVRKGGK
jgi:hypothetical protein